MTCETADTNRTSRALSSTAVSVGGLPESTTSAGPEKAKKKGRKKKTKSKDSTQNDPTFSMDKPEETLEHEPALSKNKGKSKQTVLKEPNPPENRSNETGDGAPHLKNNGESKETLGNEPAALENKPDQHEPTAPKDVSEETFQTQPEETHECEPTPPTAVDQGLAVCRNGYKMGFGSETYDECPCVRCLVRSRQVYVEGFDKMKSNATKLGELTRIFRNCPGFVKVTSSAPAHRSFWGAFVKFDHEHQAIEAIGQMHGTEHKRFTREGGLRVAAPRFSKHFRPDESQSQRQGSSPNRGQGDFRRRGNPRWNWNSRQRYKENGHSTTEEDMQQSQQDMQARQQMTPIMTRRYLRTRHPDFDGQYQSIPPTPLSSHPTPWGHQNTGMSMNMQLEPG